MDKIHINYKTTSYHVVVEGGGVSVDGGYEVDGRVVEGREEAPHGGVQGLPLPLAVRHLAHHGA